MGRPTQFVRFGGCNYRCPGWPCDTIFAIDPKFRNDWEAVSAEQVADRIMLRNAVGNVCYTGGEPMLQLSSELDYVVRTVSEAGFDQEMFSNGSLEYTSTILTMCDIVMDWKLPKSGEHLKDVKMRVNNLNRMEQYGTPGRHSIKFVCGDADDLVAAFEDIEEYSLYAYRMNIFFGAVWGSIYTTADLVAALMERAPVLAEWDINWRLNVQTHNYIWPAHERRR